VLVAESRISSNGVHIYEIPVPSTFMEPGGERGVDISLAFSPQTRVRRLDYAASRMEFHLVRGMSIDEIRETFSRVDGQDIEDGATHLGNGDSWMDPAAQAEPDIDDQEGGSAKERPPTPSELGSRRIKLAPSTGVRSRGANQLGRTVFKQKLNADEHSLMHLVVRNVSRWADPEGAEQYGIAVALWRDEDLPELYADLEARLEAVIEVPIEIEFEATLEI